MQKNRNRALHMNAAYVIFLAVAATVVLLLCVNYVRLQSELTRRSKHVTALQEELADLKEENTTKYNAVVDSVNLDEIRERAINQLGMTYAAADQIVEYDNPASDYVKQYENIPEKAKNSILPATSQSLLNCIRDVISGKSMDMIEKLAKTATNFFIEDWNDKTKDEFESTLKNIGSGSQEKRRGS